MHKLRYLPQAERDLLSNGQYIARESGSTQTALDSIDKLDEQCVKLAAMGGKIGHPRPALREGIRSFVYGNYVIFFAYEGEYITVASIIEGHRDIEAIFAEDV